MLENYSVDYGTVTISAAPDTMLAELPAHPTLPQIKRLQDAVGAAPQVEIPVEHYFSPGQYTRKCFIPGGTIVVGKMHRHRHPVMLVKGTARINTDKGMETIEAGHVWISQDNAKRAVYAVTDCEFVTVHLNPTDTQDLDAIEAEVIVPEALIEYEPRTEAGPFAIELQGAYE